MKTKSQWFEDNNEDNMLGFFALPAGLRSFDGEYHNLSENTYFWSAIEMNEREVYINYLSENSNVFYNTHWSKSYNFSIRCLMNSN